MTVIGAEEKAAVLRVLDSGVLSGFIAGSLHGGPEVQALEREWAAYFGFKHAVAMNSATSGLIAACGAVGIEWADRVIVPPLTMSATAVAPMVYGAEAVFADVEPDYFCLDPAEVVEIIHDDIDAIITVDLFGQMSNPLLRRIADDHNVPLIQDASQRPIPGGFGDIVVYSLNYHKHIHCGEGGVACTNDDTLAKTLRLIRNHGENSEGFDDFGFNFRMAEIEAAIARVQLTQLPGEILRRQFDASFIDDLAPIRPGHDHAFYLFPHRGKQGFQYQKPLTHLPIFDSDPEECPLAEEVWKTYRMLRP